jgi:hypothetical protein
VILEGMTQLPHSCHICEAELIPNPLYLNNIVVYCPYHGDFFFQNYNGYTPWVVFQAFPEDGTPEEITKANYADINRRNRSVPIRCDQTGKVYPSMLAACHDLKLHHSDMNEHMVGRARMVKGYTFKRMSELTRNDIPLKPMVYRGFAVRCDQTGEEFKSAGEAARVLGLDRDTVIKNLKGTVKIVGKKYTFTRL